jgi:hypothetical protein
MNLIYIYSNKLGPFICKYSQSDCFLTNALILFNYYLLLKYADGAFLDSQQKKQEAKI